MKPKKSPSNPDPYRSIKDFLVDVPTFSQIENLQYQAKLRAYQTLISLLGQSPIPAKFKKNAQKIALVCIPKLLDQTYNKLKQQLAEKQIKIFAMRNILIALQVWLISKLDYNSKMTKDVAMQLRSCLKQLQGELLFEQQQLILNALKTTGVLEIHPDLEILAHLADIARSQMASAQLKGFSSNTITRILENDHIFTQQMLMQGVALLLEGSSQVLGVEIQNVLVAPAVVNRIMVLNQKLQKFRRNIPGMHKLLWLKQYEFILKDILGQPHLTEYHLTLIAPIFQIPQNITMKNVQHFHSLICKIVAECIAIHKNGQEQPKTEMKIPQYEFLLNFTQIVMLSHKLIMQHRAHHGFGQQIFELSLRIEECLGPILNSNQNLLIRAIQKLSKNPLAFSTSFYRQILISDHPLSPAVNKFMSQITSAILRSQLQQTMRFEEFVHLVGCRLLDQISDTYDTEDVVVEQFLEGLDLDSHLRLIGYFYLGYLENPVPEQLSHRAAIVQEYFPGKQKLIWISFLEEFSFPQKYFPLQIFTQLSKRSLGKKFHSSWDRIKHQINRQIQQRQIKALAVKFYALKHLTEAPCHAQLRENIVQFLYQHLIRLFPLMDQKTLLVGSILQNQDLPISQQEKKNYLLSLKQQRVVFQDLISNAYHILGNIEDISQAISVLRNPQHLIQVLANHYQNTWNARTFQQPSEEQPTLRPSTVSQNNNRLAIYSSLLKLMGRLQSISSKEYFYEIQAKNLGLLRKLSLGDIVVRLCCLRTLNSLQLQNVFKDMLESYEQIHIICLQILNLHPSSQHLDNHIVAAKTIAIKLCLDSLKAGVLESRQRRELYVCIVNILLCSDKHLGKADYTIKLMCRLSALTALQMMLLNHYLSAQDMVIVFTLKMLLMLDESVEMRILMHKYLISSSSMPYDQQMLFLLGTEDPNPVLAQSFRSIMNTYFSQASVKNIPSLAVSCMFFLQQTGDTEHMEKLSNTIATKLRMDLLTLFCGCIRSLIDKHKLCKISLDSNIRYYIPARKGLLQTSDSSNRNLVQEILRCFTQKLQKRKKGRQSKQHSSQQVFIGPHFLLESV